MTAKEMFEKKGFNLEKSYDETLETYICIQYNFNIEMHYGITFNIERKHIMLGFMVIKMVNVVTIIIIVLIKKYIWQYIHAVKNWGGLIKYAC